MAGRSPNTLAKPVPMACNACSLMPSGTTTACAMTCAPWSARPCAHHLVCPSILSPPRSSPSWSSTKVASPNADTTPLASLLNSVDAPDAWKTVRSASFSPTSPLRVMPSSTASCICPTTGVLIRSVGRPLIFLSTSPLPANPN